MPRPPSITAVAPGAVIAGRYRLGGVLGRGGMAVVYDGHDLRLERPVAVKLLRPEMAARDDIRTRFEVEARAAAGLSHPNAVAVYDTGEHEGVPFLVMERLPGETLADRIEPGLRGPNAVAGLRGPNAVANPVDPGWLLEVSTGLLDALATAHDAGIVHRDVKPGNILLSANGTAKIADFGIAKSSSGSHADLTSTGQLLGTPAYLAPERIEGAPATPRSDLWALGVVLYEALAGQKPFVGRSPIEVARAVAAGDHVPLGDVRPDLDPDLVAAVEKAMATDPADRFPSARAMAAALRTGADATTVADPGPDGTLSLPLDEVHEPVPPPAPVPVRRRTRPAPRRGPQWVGLAILGVLIVLALAMLARSGNDRTPDTSAQSGPATTAAPGTTAVPATTAPASPHQGLIDQLRTTAGKLNPRADGAQAPALADGLRRVADALHQNSTSAAANEAVAVVNSAVEWNQAGQLTDAVVLSVSEQLDQVPGVQVSVSSSSANTGSSSSSSSSSGNSGKGKNNDDDD